MDSEIFDLLDRLESSQLSETSVISWGCPVPSFGDLSSSIIATLGLNPSNLEFVDQDGNELNGHERRFHTLNSLGISTWEEAKEKHVELIARFCKEYFFRNPYDRWFKRLDYIISGTSFSYYFPSGKACHLDLIPYATSTKWGELSSKQKSILLELTGDTLGHLLNSSSIEVLILNGKSVIDNFQSISNIEFIKCKMPSWTLPRKNGEGVSGVSYQGSVTHIGGVKLNRKVKILGYNHNIQSSFGVTKEVQTSIRNWVTQYSCKYLS